MADSNMPIINKRVWSMVRVLYYMLRKGISMSKLQADINLLLKRGKIARKTIIHNLVLPHLTSSASPISHGQHHSRGRHMTPPPTEYEFSCSNTPVQSLFPAFHSKRNKHSLFFGCAHAPRTDEEEDEEAVATANAVKMVLEMLNNHNDIANNDEKFERMMVQPSPLPGFGKSPAVPVRQLRVTNSPFPLHDVGGDRQVDEKAEKFIAKFYNDLKRQRILATPSPGRPWW